MKIYINLDHRIDRAKVKKFIQTLRDTDNHLQTFNILARLVDEEQCYCAGGVALTVCGFYPDSLDAPRYPGQYNDMPDNWQTILRKEGIPVSNIFTNKERWTHVIPYKSVAYLNDELKLNFDQIADCYQALLDGKTEVEV